MFPKVAAALSRALDPIPAVEKPGQSIQFNKAPDSGEGGHGALGYSALENPESGSEEPSEKAEKKPGMDEEHPEKHYDPVPFRPGLTQVILDLKSAKRTEVSSETAAASYETGAKEQKKNAHLPKGSMLDKKAG